MPSVAARLVSIVGLPLEQVYDRRRGRTYRATRNLTWQRKMPDFLEVVEGSWWEERPRSFSSQHVSRRPRGSASRSARSSSGWSERAGSRQGCVVASRRSDSPRLTLRLYSFSQCVEGRTDCLLRSARVAPEQAPELQRAAFEKFPSVTIISIADVLRIVQEIVDQIALVIRFVSAFTVLAGIVILASSVIATRLRRVRETAILKTLGATRARVTGIFSVEFLILGLSCGTDGQFVGNGFYRLAPGRIARCALRV